MKHTGKLTEKERLTLIGKIINHFTKISIAQGIDPSDDFVGSKFDELYEAGDEYILELAKRIENGRN